jgi:N-acetylmuramic acid 6-phosphate etherase
MKNTRTHVVFNELGFLVTEKRNPDTSGIDAMDIAGILRAINNEDTKVALAVRKEIPHITRAVHYVVCSLRKGGRLFYVGAGTSGRLGVLDASECPPTFGTDPDMVQGIMAGGKKAVFRSQEGSEDLIRQGGLDIKKYRVTGRDVVCGIAASARTPYVRGALAEAKRRRAHTILVTTNPRSVLRRKEFSRLRASVDVAICPEVGPEVIMGSTRMKSGTAQKMVLNMISTASMIRMGKVYGNMMVDLQMKSNKLRERAKRVVMIVTGVSYRRAAETLGAAGGHVKTAIVMILSECSPGEARARLKKAKGFVHAAV